MYPYNYNIPQFNRNMYRQTNNDTRFIGGGLFGPLLLGGIAGYAIGNNRPNYYYPRPYYYPTYYNNYYYYNPYYY